MNLNLSSVFRIIGLVLAVISLSMLPSFIVSLIYDSSDVYSPFFIIMALCFFAGVSLMKLCSHKARKLKVRDGFLIVTICWLLSAAIGALPFIVTGSIPDPVDAFFESCSGFSTTGSTILEDIEILPRGILFWRSFTHWIGGMGILVFAIALMPSLGISGQNVAVSEAPGPSLDKITPKMSDTAKSLYIIYLIFTVVETILLMLGGMDLYDALIHTFGSVGTGGLSTYNDSVGHFDSLYINVVITVFMILCGMNFNLFFMSFKNGIRTLIDDFELRFYMLIFIAVSMIIFAALMITGTYTSVKTALSDSFFQVASILTTTGYSTADYETWPSVCQALIFMLMFIGGCSSSTGGGLKVIRIAVLLKLIRRGISTKLHPNVIETVKLNGRTISSDTVSSIANHTFLYIMIVFAGAFIVSFENADLATCFSSVITCLGNVGPGFGAVGPSETFAGMSALSKLLLSIYMIAGRLELYTMFILIFPRFWNPDH